MKKAWNDFVRDKMNKHNMSQTDVGDALEKSQGTIGHWLIGRRKPNFIDVAEMLDVVGTKQVILNSDGTLEDLELVGKPKNGSVKVIGEAVMGSDGFLDMEYSTIGEVDIYSSDPEAFCLKVRGDSMEPRIYSGEFVLIEPNSQLCNGDEVFLRTKSGKNMIKIFEYEREGEYRFSSINQAHKSFNLPVDKVEAVMPVSAILKRSRFIDL